jgi:hypothetical protein
VPLILIADDCLGSVGDLRPNELVALAGKTAVENNDGGFFTQALLTQLRDEQKQPKMLKLSSAFFSAALTVFDKSGKQQSSVVIWQASSPDIGITDGKLIPMCDGASEGKPEAR